MRWLKDGKEVEDALRQGSECASTDDPLRHPGLERLTFDSVEFHSRTFLHFLRKLMEWSGDKSFQYAVLNPDPINYFFASFQRYPLIEIAVDDTADASIAALTEAPDASPADAIGTNWSEYVIVPPSKQWCIHAKRDARSGEGGHLWVPQTWSDKVKEVYPYALH